MQAKIFTDQQWEKYFCSPVQGEKPCNECDIIDFSNSRQKIELSGDVCIYLNHIKRKSKEDKNIVRFQFNTAFLKKHNDGLYHFQLDIDLLDPIEIRSDKLINNYKNFNVDVVLSDACD